jgi:hypothetical protein
MADWARDEFLRRYATSPIHVPRLERFLAAYEAGDEDDAFCHRFIAWDRASSDGEAARIVTEILSAGDSAGRIRRLSDAAVKGAIRWMSDARWLSVHQRARVLRERLTAADETAVAEFVAFLEAADTAEDSVFKAAAESIARPVTSEVGGSL